MNDKDQKANNFMGAAIFGAMIGAAAVAFLHKGVRRDIKKALYDAMEAGDEKLGELKEKTNQLKNQAVKKAERGLEKTRQKLEQAA